MIKAEKLITENFDLWTSGVKAKSIKGRGTADGNDSYGIKKLRRLILKLATEGLLTEQDSKDECASDQLKRIKQAEMDNKKNQKKQKSVKTAILEPEANSLPSGWATTNLESLVTVLNGRAYKKNELLNSGTPVLRVGNLFTSSHWYYSDLVLEDDKYCQSGDLIFAWSASFGPFIWKGPKAIYHYHIWKLLPHREEDISKNFLLLVLQEKTEAIKNEGHGVAMLHMTKAKMEKLLIRLPPLAEQKRIVAKVDKLMSLCDQLEKKQRNNIETHNILISSLLNAFTSATTDSSNFFQAWQFIKTNFDTLFKTESSIDQLKQTICQLAVMGMLIPQDPNDEPSSELLKRSNAAKELLIEEKKIKKHSPLEDIDIRNTEFTLPRKWQWEKLGNLVEMYNGRAFKSTEWRTEGIPIIRIQNLNDKNASFNYFKGELADNHKISNGDFLISWSGTPGTSFGAFIWQRGKAALNQHINKCLFYSDEINLEFMKLAVNGKLNHFISKAQGGVGLKHVTKETLNNAILAIPPISEQNRIVSKVNELMALCDQLQSSLATAQITQLKLADSIVEKAIG